jgi:hypothetical protein
MKKIKLLPFYKVENRVEALSRKNADVYADFLLLKQLGYTDNDGKLLTYEQLYEFLGWKYYLTSNGIKKIVLKMSKVPSGYKIRQS